MVYKSEYTAYQPRKGIYRCVVGFPFGPPNLEKHMTNCKENNRINNLYPINDLTNQTLRLHELYLSEKIETPYYYESPFSFFKAWKKGYDTNSYGGILDKYVKGFELLYTNWNESDYYFEIGSWKGIDNLGNLKGIPIITDLNGILDFDGWIAVGVNDFDKKRILTYKPKIQVSEKNQLKWRENTLITNEDPYFPQFGEIEFPFSSLNPCKTEPFTWTSIGYSPNEIYNSFKEIGFIFPNIDSN